ncbi:MAG: tRNA (N6-threonylcarbamoyladenosine(37)-N6)-methyltransferase TrmO [Deltaproteobacteria bacterium]|uniref:tRNA (N6-threonylcarbamoyladenosine(37)-N6)-methyltransferase TrmO n=1 Tax=Candidatus Zymogenus saltonus TaxID=2844893 RepID=A0A9D8KBD6_9DELT|nr:tRNA (N6-threonylcarbamoyladenosine(37)-N6)-methyltransferase TrmO [Candidatus Zymogenus saltonus]
MSKKSGDLLDIHLKPIGTIRTPYRETAPFQPIESETGDGEFKIILLPEYEAGLEELSKFRYIYVLSYLNRAGAGGRMKVSPPWAGGREVGLFASRSSSRPNPIGLSIVKVLRIEANELFTSSMDLLDNTPLLDIKPYFKDLDAKEDANCGWLEGTEGRGRFIDHIRGASNTDGYTHGGDDRKDE